MPKKRTAKKITHKASTSHSPQKTSSNNVTNLSLSIKKSHSKNTKPIAKVQADKNNALQTFFRKSSVKTKVLFGLGILLLIIPTFFYINEFVQLSLFTPKIPIVAVRKQFAPPVEVQIPAVHIDLAVNETAIIHNIWQISDSGASHLAISSRPGEEGPIILYGHNTNDRFGPIRWLNPGEEIQVVTADSKVHTYKITKTLDVNPDKTTIFYSEKEETLFLYTCDGFADLQRFVVIAKPVES